MGLHIPSDPSDNVKVAGTSFKITSKHLSLLAVVYIRRSTARQVENNHGSILHQRTFVDLARSYGFSSDKIVVVEYDDGKSALTDTEKRKGFMWLRQQIFAGQVGAIVCWEASRVARDNSDSAQLFKLCGAYNTLIIDEKRVYDPNDLNDMIVLGMLSVINHAEAVRTGGRSWATKRSMAEAGKLRISPATGFVYNDEGKLVLDPREEVQKAILLVFSSFDKLGSAGKVTKYINRNQIKFPTLKKGSLIEWGEISITRVIGILKNPSYAGTFVYGHSKTINEMVAPDSGEQRKKREYLGLDSDEVIIRHGSHEGYITWEKYTQNQKTLKDNSYALPFISRGAVREGSALLQGMVWCATCKTRLSTTYGNKSGEGLYDCNNKTRHFGRPNCFQITAHRLDQLVIDALMEELEPTRWKITLMNIEEACRKVQPEDCDELEELNLAKKARDEAQIRFDLIKPENTLVFNKYQDKLQEKEVEVKRLEKRHARTLKGSQLELTKELLQSLSSLPHDIRAFWDSTNVTNPERKHLLRFLIRRVTITRRGDSKYHDVTIHWVTGVNTATKIHDGRFLDPEAVKLMRQLAPDHTTKQIIARLHEAGFRLKGGKEWFNRHAIENAFKVYGIKFACPENARMVGSNPRGDGRYSASAVAKMVNVTSQTVTRWCDLSILDGIRGSGFKSHYWVKITPEQVSALKKPPRNRISKSVVKKDKST
jgi:DNA invertase Pin-like site-specific DNA recombinase